MKVGFVSLGCSKNLVDTEMTIGILKQYKYEIVNNVEDSEIIVINTCGFIESAKQEAINTILEMAKYKETGKCKYLIVMGCLVERYLNKLKKLLPEVDLFIPIKEYANIGIKIQELITNKKQSLPICNLEYSNRVISTGNTTAYLKIAEGCSNRCTYCAIPYIRGNYISREFEDIVAEAKELAKKGYKEIILIAQDTTKYGLDIYGKMRLAELLETLCKIKEFKWIRFLYAYPESITDELIQVVKNNDKICKYFDIPIQHISDGVLKRMNRKSTSKQIEELVVKIKNEIPNVVLRTSLIVGFPGESEEDFNKLYDFVGKAYFDKLGVFKYSKEDGTPASRLKEQVHYKTKEVRYKKIMELAQKISKEKLEEKIGNKYEVLIENRTFDNRYYVGRSYMDIPDTDWLVFIPKEKENLIDTWINCEIDKVKNYDLVGCEIGK